MKKISVLGSTGSIGTQTLDVAENSDNIEIVGLTAGSNIKLLEQQIRKFKPKYAACADEKMAALLKLAVSDTETTVLSGKRGLCEIAADTENDAVVTSIVGIAGLEPTMVAINNGIDIAPCQQGNPCYGRGYCYA